MNEIHTRMTTLWVIGVAAVVIGAWDLYARREPGATVSEVVLNAALRHPLVPFMLGVLMGHLFWPQLLPAGVMP